MSNRTDAKSTNELYGHVVRHWLTGLAVMVVILIVFMLWLESRDNYHAVARLNIGSHMNLHDSLYPKLEYIESVGDAENYANNVIIAEAQTELKGICTVQGLNNGKPQLLVQCSGESRQDAEKRAETIVDLILAHHLELNDLRVAHSKLIKDYRSKKLNRIDERLSAMKEVAQDDDFKTWFVRGMLYDLEDRREELLRELEIDDIQASQSRLTALDPVGVVVIDRTLGVGAWATVVIISVMSGLVSMVLLGLGDILRMRMPDGNEQV